MFTKGETHRETFEYIEVFATINVCTARSVAGHPAKIFVQREMETWRFAVNYSSVERQISQKKFGQTISQSDCQSVNFHDKWRAIFHDIWRIGAGWASRWPPEMSRQDSFTPNIVEKKTPNNWENSRKELHFPLPEYST